MRILFWGSTSANAGPDNINKGIVSSLTDSFLYVPAGSGYVRMLRALWKLLQADALVVSGVTRKGHILISAARLLKKPSAYIMHGSGAYERELNRIQGDETGIKLEAAMLEKASLLLPVSRKFMKWVQENYPQYAEKTSYLYNGVDESVFRHAGSGNAREGSVIAAGGLSLGKNNSVLSEAVEQLDGRAFLEIYGNPVNQQAWNKKHSRIMGGVSHDVFVRCLSESSLFVLNSLFESFSIATLEALALGCSILVSEAAGVTDLLALEETDLIHDPMNVDEIREKISYLLEHPNNERIRSQFDPAEWSFSKMVQRLEIHCQDMIRNRK